MFDRKVIAMIAAGAAMSGAQAVAQVTITQGNSAPSYATTLNFDEPGGPVSNPIFSSLPNTSWQGTHGIILDSQDSVQRVGVYGAATGNPWLPANNTFMGGFGMNVTFDQGVTEFSLQHWDNSGPGGPFGGGFRIDIYDGAAAVGSLFGTPAWGSNDNSWIDLVAGAGTSFDRVEISGFGSSPMVFADNMSWNTVPAPGSLALMGLGGLIATRRRRG